MEPSRCQWRLLFVVCSLLETCPLAVATPPSNKACIADPPQIHSSYFDLPLAQGHIETVDSPLSSEAFEKYTVGWGKPLLIKNEANNAAARHKRADVEYLEENYGALPVEAWRADAQCSNHSGYAFSPSNGPSTSLSDYIHHGLKQ
jgi:hypothetical protein